MLCTSYHDQRHAEFRYNFANYFSIWDRMLGTVSPDYDARVAAFVTDAGKLNFRAKRAEQDTTVPRDSG